MHRMFFRLCIKSESTLFTSRVVLPQPAEELIQIDDLGSVIFPIIYVASGSRGS
ncbi:hypothetical protein NHE_0440 [Neorickettsia helminthoeca str. Oregon]|uniref:Uncharacterized protein n=1 Tax=Neorickettsia helminthoeca str. Oregon TaxID=1286528 RepID=X5HLT0_9RICK|nr:hypothetical protein NHE_0440 [Neorickettsia helminthoeca str. Oregon]